MVGIYKDSFVEYLKKNLGDNITIKTKNLIIPCPWCEYGDNKDHYHLYVSTESPIFNCFHAGCPAKGHVKKLIKKIEGTDISDNFIDKSKVKSYVKKKVELERQVNTIQFGFPKIEGYENKRYYLRSRFKFQNVKIEEVPRLVFNVKEFVNMNHIKLDYSTQKMIDYLDANFIGFVTKNHGMMILRNIRTDQDFRHYKINLQPTSRFMDYYSLNGYDPRSNKVVFAEGIFDIFNEFLFDTTDLRKGVRLYASTMSDSYEQIIKSIAHFEQIYRMNVVILSDQGLTLDFYKKLKKANSHLIESLTVYFNRAGKDFGSAIVEPEKFII